MKKYWLVFTQSLSQFVAYRLEILFQIFQNFLPPLTTLLILTYAGTSTVNTASLLTYYLFVTLTTPLAISSVDEQLDDMAGSGDVNNFLTKPFSLFRWLLAKNASEKVLTGIFLSPLIILLLVIFPTQLYRLIYFPFILSLSFLLSYIFSYIVGLGCFWLDEFWAIRNVKIVAIQLFSGLILPYSILPAKLMSVIYLTPFPYIAGWPGRFLQSGTNLPQMTSAIFWLIALGLILRLFQRQAIRHYSHTGS